MQEQQQQKQKLTNEALSLLNSQAKPACGSMVELLESMYLLEKKNDFARGEGVWKDLVARLVENVIEENASDGYHALHLLLKKYPHLLAHKHYVQLNDALTNALAVEMLNHHSPTSAKSNTRSMEIGKCIVLLPMILGSTKSMEASKKLLSDAIDRLEKLVKNFETINLQDIGVNLILVKSCLHEELVTEFPLHMMIVNVLQEIVGEKPTKQNSEVISLAMDILNTILGIFNRSCLPFVGTLFQTVESIWKRFDEEKLSMLGGEKNISNEEVEEEVYVKSFELFRNVIVFVDAGYELENKMLGLFLKRIAALGPSSVLQSVDLRMLTALNSTLQYLSGVNGRLLCDVLNVLLGLYEKNLIRRGGGGGSAMREGGEGEVETMEKLLLLLDAFLFFVVLDLEKSLNLVAKKFHQTLLERIRRIFQTDLFCASAALSQKCKFGLVEVEAVLHKRYNANLMGEKIVTTQQIGDGPTNVSSSSSSFHHPQRESLLLAAAMEKNTQSDSPPTASKEEVVEATIPSPMVKKTKLDLKQNDTTVSIEKKKTLEVEKKKNEEETQIRQVLPTVTVLSDEDDSIPDIV